MYKKNHIKHEKPVVRVDAQGNRKKNPNQITVSQHVIPQAHLNEWIDTKGLLSVYNTATGSAGPIRPVDAFVVERLWNQWAERRMLYSNEVNYQKQVDLIKLGEPISNHQHLSAYFTMLCSRMVVAHKKRPHYPSTMMELNYTASQAELEELEISNLKSHVHMIKAGDAESQDGARLIVSMHLQMDFVQWMRQYESIQWEVLKLESGRFILPDYIQDLLIWGRPMLPISPKLAVIGSELKRRLQSAGWLNERGINTLLKAGVVRHYVQ
ncbi:hypothetical protein J3Q00_19400 [Pseudomonas sp. D2-3]